MRGPLSASIAAVALAGCGTEIDGNSIERELTDAYGKRGYPKLRFDCPNPENEVGKRFTCKVRGLDGYTNVEVEVRENEALELVREY